MGAGWVRVATCGPSGPPGLPSPRAGDGKSPATGAPAPTAWLSSSMGSNLPKAPSRSRAQNVGVTPMEVSRSSPRGFFSSLKSLFVDRAPLYVPDVELHFFEASHDYLELPLRYRPTCLLYNKAPFPQQTTRFIWCAVTVSWAVYQTRLYTLSYTIYRPDG